MCCRLCSHLILYRDILWLQPIGRLQLGCQEGLVSVAHSLLHPDNTLTTSNKQVLVKGLLLAGSLV
jgi:hypothetical protein